MHHLPRWAGALALVLMPSLASAQHATTSAAPAGYAPEYAPVTLAATSIPQEGAITSTTATPTSGTVAISGSSAIVGPLIPQLGRDIRVVLKGTWTGSVAIGTSSAANACAPGTINPLTIAGQPWGVYTSNANEGVDTPALSGVVYCATATITAGTLSYAVRQ